MAEALAGFDRTDFGHGGTTKPVFAAGGGPAVIVMHELPGITPELLGFARRVAGAGFRVYVPSLFGVPGRPHGTVQLAASMVRACLSRELAVWAAERSSPIVDWLRALARHAQAECGGRAVGAVGMCITGNFALAMAVEPGVEAPVLSQPSMPWAIPLPPFGRLAQGLHLEPSDVAALRERTRSGLSVLGLRFADDWQCPAARFERLRAEFGPAFEAIEIGADLPAGAPGRRGHSVLTLDLVDRPGEPTRAALDRVIAFLVERLRPAGAA
ncbi:MAG: dienelactone hydrolase family protein [Alphaproteobacteria bacterium]|nr:dienelactone hydrolase family protein [Alphaproteobacteria bacterium]